MGIKMLLQLMEVNLEEEDEDLIVLKIEMDKYRIKYYESDDDEPIVTY